jgi:cell division septation protein DedD
MVNPDRNLYEPPYDDALLYDTETEPERPRSRSLIVMLGFVVVAAFAGVVWVAYNQGVIQGQRDQNPPVLEGDAGPYQQAPDTKMAQSDPSAVGAEKTYDELWAEDGAEAGAASTDPAPGVDRQAPTTQEVVAENVEGGQGGPPIGASIDPRMDPTVELTDPAAAAPPVEGPVVRDATPPAPAPAPAVRTVAAAPSAPKPIVRSQPTPAAAVPAPAPQIMPEAPAAVAEAPPPPPSGGIGIQLGAFPSADQAAAQWSKIKGRHQALLGPYTPRFQPVQVEGKGELFRLRVVGFSDKSAAKSACDEIIGAGGACMTVGK